MYVYGRMCLCAEILVCIGLLCVHVDVCVGVSAFEFVCVRAMCVCVQSSAFFVYQCKSVYIVCINEFMCLQYERQFSFLPT